MFFTQEDYKKIEKWLQARSVKDTEFQEANPLAGTEEVAIVQDGKNRIVTVKDFANQLSLLGIDDFINVTSKYNAKYISLEDAIQIVPFLSRKVGQVITFLNTEGEWHIYQFRGESILQWNVATLWVDILESEIINSILPDEEDLTKTAPDANGNSYLKFKNKDYNNIEFSGLGRVFVRKNIKTLQDPNTLITRKINYLSQEQIADENTIYIIQYNHDLNGQTIIIPENSVLFFEGGTITNGVIEGQNTNIVAGKNVIFGIGTTITGTWNITDIYDYWFEFNSASGDNFIANDIIKNILALTSDTVSNVVHFDADRTYYFELPYKGRANLGDDVRPDYWKLFTDDYAFLRIFTGVTSNTHFIFNNTLQMIPTNQGAYSVFYISDKSNIEISGKGSINGDALNHKYTDPFAGTEYYGEFGFIFDFKSCNNIVVKDVTIGYAFGDNILFSNTVQDNNEVKTVGLPTNNVIVNNTKILFARRNGIALGGNNYSISDVYFEGNGSDTIRGTAPKAAIDFENDFLEEPSSISNNITMTSCKFKDNKFDVSSFIYPSIATDITNSVTITNCNFTAPLRLNTITTGMTFNDCHIVGISSHDNSIIPWYNSKNLVFNSCIFDELNPYLSTTAKEQGKTFNNCKFPEDTEYSTIFRVLLNPGEAAKISIPKPIIGEIELSAIGFNSGVSPTYLPINHTIYTFGNTQALTNIKDIKLYTNTGTTSIYGLYRSVPVFSNITYTEDANNYNIYFTLGGELISNPYTTISDFNVFLKSKTRYIVVTAPVTDTPNTQGIYGGKWSEVSAVTISTINVSDIPSTVTFPNKDMFPASLLADMPTSLTSDKVGKSIFLLDNDYKRPAFWDSYSSVWRDAAGFKLFERRASSISALNTLAAKLTITDVGYPCYMSQYGTQLTWDGTKWLNPDGTDFSQVRIITNSTNLATNVSYNDLIYKIVGNIDLGGGELTIASGSTLDFQGGLFSNGTIRGNGTDIKAPKQLIFKNCIISPDNPFRVTDIYTEWFDYSTSEYADNRAVIQNMLNMANTPTLTQNVHLNKSLYVSKQDGVDDILIVYPYTNIILSGDIKLNANSDGLYNILSLAGVNNVNIYGGGTIKGDYGMHTGSTGEWGHGINVSGSSFIRIYNITISNCWGDGIAFTEFNNNPANYVWVDNCLIQLNRRQGISVIAGLNIFITNCKIETTGRTVNANTGTPPMAGIDIEPNNEEDSARYVFIKDCTFNSNEGGAVLVHRVPKTLGYIDISNCVGLSILDNLIFANAHYVTVRECTFNLFKRYGDSQYEASNNKIINCIFPNQDYNEYKLLNIGNKFENTTINRYIVGLSNSGTSDNRAALNNNDIGFMYFDTILEKPIWWNGDSWVDVDGYPTYKKVGTTAERPNIPSGTYPGFQYYDTDLKKPIWWNGTAWKDATGTVV